MTDYEKILDFIKEVGSYQLENFETVHTIDTKSTIHDLVTEVDMESEKRIFDFIETHYPDHAILGEEGSSKETTSGYKWIIDPLDGTVNYAHGFPIFSISMGLEKDGEFVFGAVYAPKLDELFYAQKGCGAFLNGKKISVSQCQSVEEALLGTGFAYVREGKYDNLKYFSHFYPISRGIRRPGSAAFDLACVAAGRLDGFWEFNLKPWDVAAGMGIIEEAGGLVIDLSSEEAGSSLIAGNQRMAELILEELEKAGLKKESE